VVDDAGRPLGILRESRLKNYVYSPFGKDLIANKQLGRTMTEFVVKCPVIDLATPFDRMLAIFSATDHADGILITTNMVYRGFLSAHSLIRAVHEKTLDRAREENPLTRLAGNAAINEYIAGRLADGEGALLAYIDFDNFKPFNDTYGFRQGDRAIMLFTDLMKKRFGTGDAFLGHVGGDDFFLGLRNHSLIEVEAQILNLLESFRQDVESFYSPEHREAGFIEVKDRNDEFRRFPLMGVSAAVIEMPSGEPGSRIATVDCLSTHFADLKKLAKKKCKGFCAATVIGNERTDERGATQSAD
jgi:diguanylate cyclase (GGDEF)-like protein